MARNALILAVLTALLMGAGVWVGYDLRAGEPAAGPPADLLRAEASAPPTREVVPTLLGESLDERVLARLGRLEEAVAALRAEQTKLAKAIEPGAELWAYIQSKMPEYAQGRQRADRTAAIATLRNVTSAQAQTQATGRVDSDGDGTGEYAGFREMSGATEGRMSRRLVPPVLSSVFKTLSASGEATRSGYLYRFYLPGPLGQGIGEPQEGFGPGSGVDPDLAETTWCCYAWPVDAKAQGGTVFFINQGGDVLTTEDPRYSGEGHGPEPDAAFVNAGAITGMTAIGRRGRDGNVWKQAN